MTNNQDLFDLFHRKLREMWFAEKKIHTSLRKMANAAQSDALRAAFRKHEAETQGQIALGTVFGLIDRIAARFAAFAHGRLCEGFRMPAHDGGARYTEGRRPKTSKGGNRDGLGESAARALWGIERGRGPATGSSASVLEVGVHGRRARQQGDWIDGRRLACQSPRECDVAASAIVAG